VVLPIAKFECADRRKVAFEPTSPSLRLSAEGKVLDKKRDTVKIALYFTGNLSSLVTLALRL
jgi:hypothetical protein